MRYTVILEREEDGGYVVSVPALPGCVSQGDNRGEALDAFDKALTINPNAAEALVGKGLAALQKFEVQAAQQFADHALRINAKLPEALRLRADAHVVAGDLKAARKDLDQARKTP